MRASPNLIVALSVICMLAPIAGARTPHIVDTRHSQYAAVRPIGLDEVKWTQGFWADRFATIRERAVPNMWELMEGSTYKPFYEHFLIAAGKAEGDYHGAPWNDGDFYKWIEAACAVYAVSPDVELKSHLDQAIKAIADAQRADGYIHTPVLIAARNGDESVKPFQDRFAFEMYNMGHLMTAACLHHRVTGEPTLLIVAKKAADFLIEQFRNPTPGQARHAVCPSHYMGCIDMYRSTRDERYLELAKSFWEMRKLVTDGGDDNQDRLPFAKQREAVGHAVRANYLFAGAADLYLETGDQQLWESLNSLWQNVVTKKMYVTGACGALFDGASPDGSADQLNITRVHQAYGRNYQLPNVTAHNETCANVGNVLWNWRMFAASGDARFVDVAELALYNSVLSGISLDGTKFFYVNPLRQTDPLPTQLRWSRTRVPFIVSFCCPPNVLRTIAELNGYAYSKSEDAIWVNLYGSNQLTTLIAGKSLELAQETNYPWSGNVSLRLEQVPEVEFGVKLRIPGWARSATVRVNDEAVADATPGQYCEVRRKWSSGDILLLELPMPAELIESHPLVEETRNQVAVRRGPIVYCLESLDLPEEAHVLDVALPVPAAPTVQFDAELLGGVAKINVKAMVTPATNWNGQLYRVVESEPASAAEITLIPYYAWSNRGPSEMTVWLPRTQ